MKTEIIIMRVSAADKKALERSAAKVDMSLSRFVVAAALVAAQRLKKKKK